ncbi:MAG: hypothetical protein DA330_02295 [Nitrososphaera sp.]|nr:hypothetical protein [Nitrososphaera sp.]
MESSKRDRSQYRNILYLPLCKKGTKEFKTVMNTIDFAFNFLLVPIPQFNGYIQGKFVLDAA